MRNSTHDRVRQDGDVVVLLDYDLFWGDDFERRFWVAPGGNQYVYELLDHTRPGGSDRIQVCANLSDRGSTLVASRRTLAEVIRRELRDREAERRKGGY